MGDVRYIIASKAADPVGDYSHGVFYNGLLFLCGIGPRQKGSKDIPGVVLSEEGEVISYNIAEQTKATFRNLEFILEEAGSSLENILDITVFLTNMKRDFKIFNRIYADIFSDFSNKPARTTIEVGSLPTPIAVELKVIAFKL